MLTFKDTHTMFPDQPENLLSFAKIIKGDRQQTDWLADAMDGTFARVAEPSDNRQPLQFSDCDTDLKSVTGASNCIGGVLIGRNEKGGSVSLAYHLSPEIVYTPSFTKKWLPIVTEQWKQRLRIFQSMVNPDSAISAMAGGRWMIARKNIETKDLRPLYRDMISITRDLIGEELNIDSLVLTGPKTDFYDNMQLDATDLFLDTPTGRLAIRQSAQSREIPAFAASKIDEIKKHWF